MLQFATKSTTLQLQLAEIQELVDMLHEVSPYDCNDHTAASTVRHSATSSSKAY